MNELEMARQLPVPAWGWEIPVYLFLGGMAAGLMILDGALGLGGVERSARARWLAFAPAVGVSIGMGALFLDLAGKANVWRFYLTLRLSSPMSWGAWILVLAYPATLLLALSGLSAPQAAALRAALAKLGLAGLMDAARGLGMRRRREVLWANVAVGVGLGLYTGILLSSLAARALWSSGLLGPLFLVSGLSTGAAFALLFALEERERRLIARVDQGAIVVELLLLGLFLFGLAHGDAAAQQAAGLLLHGPWAPAFVGLVLTAGLGVPLLLGAIEHRRRLPATLVAPLLVLLGGLSLRWILVVAGQA